MALALNYHSIAPGIMVCRLAGNVPRFVPLRATAKKAVCLLLERRRVCYLRSDDDNLSLLLSLAEPEKLRALLER